MKNVEDKLDKIAEDITEIKITMAKNTTSLETHIKRTELLEARVLPVEKHVAMVHGALKLIGIIALIVGIIEGIVNIIK